MTKAYGAFNSGRGYTEHGQRIGWCIAAVERDPEFDSDLFDLYTVVFYDLDRTINGVITVMGEVTPVSVMREYDRGQYGYPDTEALRVANEVALQAAQDL